VSRKAETLTTYYQEPRPAREIPTREQLTAAARRQAQYEASIQGADPSYSGHSAGIHPEHRPTTTDEQIQGDYEVEEDEKYYVTRPHSSVRRYQSVPIDTRGGRVNVVAHYHDQPLRAHRNQLPPPRQQDRYTDEVETPGAQDRTRKRSRHPLLYLGVGMLAMAAIFLLLSSAGTWIQTTKDDLTYGRPRTFNIDAVVGHNDSAANPTHFIAINLNRHVEVIEQPGGDSSKMRVYQVTTLFGDGEDLAPVTLSFRDLLDNGKLDMLIHINNTVITYINDNGSFRPSKPGEIKGLV